jgi:hypothetical protein
MTGWLVAQSWRCSNSGAVPIECPMDTGQKYHF